MMAFFANNADDEQKVRECGASPLLIDGTVDCLLLSLGFRTPFAGSA
jgi:hypothetical protein